LVFEVSGLKCGACGRRSGRRQRAATLIIRIRRMQVIDRGLRGGGHGLREQQT
jgi:hypothetical protein